MFRKSPMSVRQVRSNACPLLFLVAAVLYLAGCADQIVTECEVPKGAVAMRASYSEIERQLFAQSCATAGCHAGPRPQAGLSLAGAPAYEALVGIESRTNPGRMLVNPGRPEESILLLTMRRSITPNMPPAGPLPRAVIDSVAAWIASGAQRN
jgi:hypothetical protein